MGFLGGKIGKKKLENHVELLVLNLLIDLITILPSYYVLFFSEQCSNKVKEIFIFSIIVTMVT